MKKLFVILAIAIGIYLWLVSCKSVDKDEPVITREFNDETYVWENWIVSTNTGNWTFEPLDGKP